MSDAETTTKKGLPIKTIIVVLAMLIAEGALIVGVMSFMGGPSEVGAGPRLEDPNNPDPEAILEIPLLHEKLTNSSDGRLWFWDTEILVQVKRKHKDRVERTLEERKGELRAGLAAIWGGAQYGYFLEPGWPTLSRQSLDYLRSIIGTDPEGEEMVQGVLIPSMIGMPADY